MRCCRVGCEHEAVAAVQLSFASAAMPHGPRCQFEFPLAVCDVHKDRDPGAYVSDAGWAQITDAMKDLGRAAPDRNTLQVDGFRTIGAPLH